MASQYKEHSKHKIHRRSLSQCKTTCTVCQDHSYHCTVNVWLHMESKNKPKGEEMFQGHLLGQVKNPASLYQKEINEGKNSKSTSRLHPHMCMCPHTHAHHTQSIIKTSKIHRVERQFLEEAVWGMETCGPMHPSLQVSRMSTFTVLSIARDLQLEYAHTVWSYWDFRCSTPHTHTHNGICV